MLEQSVQEPRLDDLIAHLPVGVYRTTPDGRILLANQALLEMLGFESYEQLSAEPLTDKRFGDAHHRKDFMDQLDRDGEVRDRESIWRKRDGSIIRVRETARVVRGDDGQVLFYEGGVVDATARWVAEQARQESERRYRQLIEALPHGVAIVQHEQIVFANQTCARMLGYESPDDIIGKGSTVGLSPADHDRVVPLVWKALEDDGPWPLTFQSCSVRLDGSTFPSEILCGRINYGNERALQFVIMDVSDRLAAQREREVLLAQLHHADRLAAVGQMAAGVAHEINNPLTFLLPALDELDHKVSHLVAGKELDRGQLHGDLSGAVGVLREGLERVAEVNGELARFARVSDPCAERVELSELLDACLRLAGKKIQLSSQLEMRYGQVPAVHVQRSRMMQVFLNILLNAVQTMDPAQHKDNQIRISTHLRDGQACVEIYNSGQAIPPQVAEHIFDPFFTTKPKGQGTGLGLSISAAIVEEHDGRIEVESSAERGTTFRICLPVANRKRV